MADRRYDYVETGSLISIKKNVKDIMLPSEEHVIEMFPMDFEEFLWAMGDEVLMPYIRMQFAKCLPMGRSTAGNGLFPAIPDCRRYAAGSTEIRGDARF